MMECRVFFAWIVSLLIICILTILYRKGYTMKTILTTLALALTGAAMTTVGQIRENDKHKDESVKDKKKSR